jgi:predicted RNase H-like nuclease
MAESALALAERHVAEQKVCIMKQYTLIASLRQSRARTAEAERLLDLMHELLLALQDAVTKLKPG